MFVLSRTFPDGSETFACLEGVSWLLTSDPNSAHRFVSVKDAVEVKQANPSYQAVGLNVYQAPDLRPHVCNRSACSYRTDMVPVGNRQASKRCGNCLEGVMVPAMTFRYLIHKSLRSGGTHWLEHDDVFTPNLTKAYRFHTRQEAHDAVDRMMVGYVGPNPFTVVSELAWAGDRSEGGKEAEEVVEHTVRHCVRLDAHPNMTNLPLYHTNYGWGPSSKAKWFYTLEEAEAVGRLLRYPPGAEVVWTVVTESSERVVKPR